MAQHQEVTEALGMESTALSPSLCTASPAEAPASRALKAQLLQHILWLKGADPMSSDNIFCATGIELLALT